MLEADDAFLGIKQRLRDVLCAVFLKSILN